MITISRQPPELHAVSVPVSPGCVCLCRRQEHRQSYGNTREPLLENITSDYDLELFRKAQARASEDMVRERSLNASPLASSSSSSSSTLNVDPKYMDVLDAIVLMICHILLPPHHLSFSLFCDLPIFCLSRRSCVSRARSPRAAT